MITIEKGLFAGKRILVTGGTGSFGHHIVDRLLKENPAEIRIFSRDEDKQVRMSEEYGMGHEYPRNASLNFIIGDVRDLKSVKQAMSGVDLVFHAAALKHVPLCEYHVWQAVQTNIQGAQNIIQAALDEKVKKVIAISTDKAVKPVNAMGMTKAIQEKLFIAANFHKGNKETVFACVRYGNVIGSRGSVIPLFKRQIESGGPLTVTDPDMTRFILTLSDGIDLVFQAAGNAVGGEIFVLKIPAATVADIADVMMSALSAGVTLAVKVVGVRPGEKIHEVLISEAESLRTIDAGPTYIVLPQLDLPMIDFSRHDGAAVSFQEYTSDTTQRLSKEEIKMVLGRAGWI
jgi:FlaA1/EpsC-like NDP-sugar epimerase